MPKCTINGKEVEVKEGSTIMEAYYQMGESIAHYCYHPGLSVAGVCRLCICEIEGNPRPQIACNTVVTEGMKINNKSENIKDGVKWVLDFHLINHPLDCPICDQAGECGLQDQYMEFGK
ncbi:MAG TPA: 2Fe-2S iron-sulfur cluster-binding protein, partial [Pseudobdellovibrionaceae bacterium]|nr:2Fe-2S iron-sulfur cluster-binding protein [Pseudobdellovibrionaceae bacterium]